MDELDRRAAYRELLLSQTYRGPRGEFRWRRNKAVVPMDIFEEAGFEPPLFQCAEYELEVATYLEPYKESQLALATMEMAERRQPYQLTDGSD